MSHAVTAAAALESGEYTESSVLPGPAVLDLPQTSVGLPNSGGGACGANEETTLADALRTSCNTAFGHLGMELVKQQLGFDDAYWRRGAEVLRLGERVPRDTGVPPVPTA